MRIGAAASAGVATTALTAQGGGNSGLMAGSGPGAALCCAVANVWLPHRPAQSCSAGFANARCNYGPDHLHDGGGTVDGGFGLHAPLAGIRAQRGLARWADQGMNTALPLLVVPCWVAFAPKARLAGRDAVRWLILACRVCDKRNPARSGQRVRILPVNECVNAGPATGDADYRRARPVLCGARPSWRPAFCRSVLR